MTKELDEFCHKVARDIWERGYIYVAKDDDELSRSLDDVAAILALHLANFRSSSQNQTVSIGVEGAHEGTTADKCSHVASREECAAHAREPEKLNNAPLIVEIERETDGRWLADVPSVPGITAYGSTRADAAMNALILLDNVALAESSLSSPPPIAVDTKVASMSPPQHPVIGCTDRDCAYHRDIWRWYEDKLTRSQR